MKKVIAKVSVFLGLSLTAGQEPLQTPPGGLSPEEVPMFISLGFDDNSHSGMSASTDTTGGIKWVTDFTRDLKNPAGTGQQATYDGAPVRCTFYQNSYYIDPYHGDYATLVKWALNEAYRLGHEVGNHTHSHITSGDGPSYSAQEWGAEIDTCTNKMARPAPEDSSSLTNNNELGAGIDPADITGFRSPYLRYGDGLFTALTERGYTYDCSIEEGLDRSQDGTDFYWPYTLDHLSPGHVYMAEELGTKEMSYQSPSHGEIWELPCYAVVVPADERCEQYGIEPGFRQRLADHFSSLGKPGAFDPENGKISGLDYNLYYFQEANLTKEEALAVLKNTLDLRMEGNRAPMLLGVHSQYYTSGWNSNAQGCPDPLDRQAIIEEFITYALKTYDAARIVPMKDVQKWCENPIPLSGSTAPVNTESSPAKTRRIRRQGNTLQIAAHTPRTGTLVTPRGRVVLHRKAVPQQGRCSWTLPAGLPAGTYIFKTDYSRRTVQIP